MNILTRRGFLGSLAFGSIYPNVEQFPASQLQAMGGEAHPSKILWSIAKRNLVAHLDHVDFWSKPRRAIKYADQLPSEIGRGALFYGEAAELPAKSARTRVDSMSLEKEYASLNDRFSFRHGTGIKTLTEVLRARVDANAKSSRVATTALIALDSQWSTRSGPDWTDILSAFRGCYDHLIGQYHISQRGFHHWKNGTKERPLDTSNFERVFTSAASQCDAVVFTSQSLIENDMHLPARASTESLVGELMQRFSQVLFDDHVIRKIVPTGKTNREPRHPRVYALGSAGASRTYPTIQPADLLRQRELVFSSFGKPISRPLVIGLGLDEASAEFIQAQVSNTNIIYLTGKPLLSEQADLRSSEWLKFITLWPFDPDYGPWP